MSHKKKRINIKLKKSNPAKLETVPHTKSGREFAPHTKSDTVMSCVFDGHFGLPKLLALPSMISLTTFFLFWNLFSWTRALAVDDWNVKSNDQRRASGDSLTPTMSHPYFCSLL
jgi:hypothetical protein